MRNKSKSRSKTRKTRKPSEPPFSSLILTHLQGCDGPQTFDTLCTALVRSKRQRDVLKRCLEAMVGSGQVVVTRRGAYGLASKMGLIVGRVVGHQDGFGFLIPDDGAEDLYIDARQMRRLLHGDRLVARLNGVDRRGRRQAGIVEIIERANDQVVGRYFAGSGAGYVVPDNRRIHQDVVIPLEQSGKAVDGQIVVAVITRQPDEHNQPLGRIAEVLGDHMAPGMEADMAIRAFALPHLWSTAVHKELEEVPDKVRATVRRRRTDLRELPLVTIDGEDARDFDDAVYCERTDAGWRLLVAIADVSHYVKPGSALDEQAYERGTSVYFPNRVLPMLPEALSAGICSLKPAVERLCLVCEIQFDRNGNAVEHRFFEAVMRSAARLTYTTVGKILVQRDRATRNEYRDLVPRLEQLYRLYKCLKRKRQQRGALELDTTETRFVFGVDKKIEAIKPYVRNDAHRIIEECMIAANVAAAEFLSANNVPAIYRIHEPPAAEKVDDLRTVIRELGLQFPAGRAPTPGEYAKILRAAAGRDDAQLITTLLLKSLRLAVYSPESKGHFGLALDRYTHFTSPIRRYPDLMVHRAIRRCLRAGAKGYPYALEDLRGIAEYASTAERRGDDAAGHAVAWLKCEYMLDRVGEAFRGTIQGVTGFGLFVQLDEVFIDGLIHVSNLRHDYYHFDPIHQRLTGERSGRSYKLGERVDVRVARVSVDDRRIDLELAADEEPAPTRKRRGRGRRRS